MVLQVSGLSDSAATTLVAIVTDVNYTVDPSGDSSKVSRAGRRCRYNVVVRELLNPRSRDRSKTPGEITPSCRPYVYVSPSLHHGLLFIPRETREIDDTLTTESAARLRVALCFFNIRCVRWNFVAKRSKIIYARGKRKAPSLISFLLLRLEN